MQQTPTMAKVGLDVHAAQTHAAVLDPATGEFWLRRLQGPPERALDLLASLGWRAVAVYEAGPAGFALARAAAERGLELLSRAERRGGALPRPGSRPRGSAR